MKTPFLTSLIHLIALHTLIASAAGDDGTAHWRFEESSGSIAADTAGNVDGVLSALPVWSSVTGSDPVPQSEFTNAGSLDLNWINTSNGGYVTVAAPGGALNPGVGGFTLEAWVKLDSLSNASSLQERQFLFLKKPSSSAGSQQDYSFMVQAGSEGTSGRELMFGYGDGVSFNKVVSTLEINDLNWHFVSLAFDAQASSVRFGLDGV